MKDKEKQFREEMKQEIKSRKLVVKRLEVPLKLAIAAGEKKRAARIKRLDELGEYKTANDAQEAYGYEIITEEEYNQILAFNKHF